MKLVHHSNGSITVRDFIARCRAETEAVDNEHETADNLSTFSSVLSDCDNICICDTEMSALVFIAGFVGFELRRKLSCIDCRLEMFTEKALECELSYGDNFNYLADIDRGGLTWPTELLLNIVVQCIITFNCL